MRGGSPRSGPAPDPNALRRDQDKVEWTVLPEHHDGTVPEWPLTKATLRERAIWPREWARPQAAEWARLGLEAEVAMYVRQLVRCEKPKATAADRTLLQRQLEALGLSLPGLARNRWRIGGPQPTTSREHDASTESAKERFRVLDGTG